MKHMAAFHSRQVYSPETPGNRGGDEQLLVIMYDGSYHGYYKYGTVSGGSATHHKEDGPRRRYGRGDKAFVLDEPETKSVTFWFTR